MKFTALFSSAIDLDQHVGVVANDQDLNAAFNWNLPSNNMLAAHVDAARARNGIGINVTITFIVDATNGVDHAEVERGLTAKLKEQESGLAETSVGLHPSHQLSKPKFEWG